MKTNNREQNGGEKAFVITGKTKEEIERILAANKRSDRGKGRRCYICKRREGENALAFEIGEQDVYCKEIVLHPVARTVGNSVHIYEICDECSTLLNLRENIKQMESVFAPICEN